MARVLLILTLALAQQGGALDIDKVLEKADKLLEEAKAGYESARDKGDVAGFVDAGFKLEEARIKYLVLQEIGGPEKQKVATDRMRAVNQLSKLLHDGKVAVSGARVGDAPASAPEPSKPEVRPLDKPETPPAQAMKPPADIRVRFAVPDLAKQKEAEKLIKDLFKEQYAKKAPADRQQLARLLLDQAAKAGDDAAAAWVMYREAQDAAAQVCDLRTLLGAIDGAAASFDVDSLAIKNASFAVAGRNAKTPEDFVALTRSLLQLVDEFVAADQYDAADKATAAALLHARRSNDVALALRAATRSREVAESKTLYQGMKKSLETLARNPDDPGANSEMGQLLCFVKGNWELGVRFLVKGSNADLKGLAEKELAMSIQPAEQASLGDGWWDLSEKERSPLRKSQMQGHARVLYEAALPGLGALQRLKVEKRLETADAGGVPAAGTINLLKLVDLNKDTLSGTWTMKGDKVVSDNSIARLELPYEPPAEYDLKVTFSRNEGGADVFLTLTKNNRSFNWTMASGQIWFGFGVYKGIWVPDAGCQGSIAVPSGLTNNKVQTTIVQVRKDGLKGFLDGKLLKELSSPYSDLQSHGQLRMRTENILGVGSYNSSTTFHKIELVEISGKGKKTRN
jgi:hypothetical protein